MQSVLIHCEHHGTVLSWWPLSYLEETSRTLIVHSVRYNSEIQNGIERRQSPNCIYWFVFLLRQFTSLRPEDRAKATFEYSQRGELSNLRDGLIRGYCCRSISCWPLTIRKLYCSICTWGGWNGQDSRLFSCPADCLRWRPAAFH